MENIVVLNEEQFEDIIYRTVSRCLNEKNIGNFGEKPEDEGFYTRDELCPDFGNWQLKSFILIIAY